MKPFDPRLMRMSRSARHYVYLTAALGGATAALVLAQAYFISYAATPIILGKATLAEVSPWLWTLGVVITLRIILHTCQEALSHRAARDVIRELRLTVIQKTIRLGYRWLAAGHSTPTVTLITRGLDNLEPYFVRYLPQLFLAATVTPATAVIIMTQDLISALIVAFCIPLIPIFMILIGKLTQSFAADKLELMQSLGAQILDLLAGLPTLKAFGRELGPGKRVAEIGRAYTRTTMQTLRVAFISGAALEFIATLCTALVAVEVGFRMVYGYLDLTAGLIIIMLTPEVYKPLREVGSQFHASADGVAALAQTFELCAQPENLPHTAHPTPLPDLYQSRLVWEHVFVHTPGRSHWAPADFCGVSQPGQITALCGPSGAGKTTAIMAILGLVTCERGEVTIAPQDPSQAAVNVTALALSEFWQQINWVPQRPPIWPGTLRENLFLTTSPTSEQLATAAQQTGFDSVLATLPSGWDTRVGLGGVGLSVGQRQRFALTRALLTPAPVVILDEPTAHLDAQAEEKVLHTMRLLASQGRHVIVIAHRRALTAQADVCITVKNQLVSAEVSA